MSIEKNYICLNDYTLIMFANLYQNRFILLLFIVFSSFKLNAQVENLGFLNTGDISILNKFNIGDEEVIVIRKNWKYFFYRIDYQTGAYSVLDSTTTFSWNSPIIVDSIGFYYVTSQYASNGNDVNYYLNHLDLNGVKHTSTIISTNLAPKPLHLMDHQLIYLLDSFNGQDVLKKTDSLFVNHVTILSPITPYVNSFLLNDTLRIVTRAATVFQLFTYTVVNGAHWGITLPAFGNYDQVRFVGKKDNEAFLQFNYNASYSALWKTNFTLEGSSIYIDSIQVQSIEFDGDDFLLEEYSYKYDYSKGVYSNPEARIPIPFKADLAAEGTKVDLRLGNSFLRVLSFKNGIELGHFKNDTIQLVKDLAVGSRSGWVGEEYVGNSCHQDPYFTEVVGVDSLFTVMSNGNDPHNYLYGVNGDQFTSYFPIEHPEEIVSVKKNGDYFYWLRNNESGIQLERRSLVSNLQPQPLETLEDSTLTWVRQLGYPNNTLNFWDFGYNYDFSTGCKLTPDGGVIIDFMLRDFYQNRLLSSDGYFTDSLKAAIVFCKYDQYGIVQWTQSFGDHSTMFISPPLFELDSDGNVLVSGSFYKDGYFNNDTILVDRVAYFLAKLDGITGEILWYKIISENYYSDDLILEGIEINQNNEIYLEFLLQKFSCTIDGTTINMDLKPGHVIAKFSPAGAIQFLKDCPSPWATEYGNSRIFEYSKELDKLVMGQSQAYYNWSSSCQYSNWGYASQVLDSEGNLEQSSAYSSDDIGSCVTGALTPENKLIECGYFRSTMDVDLFNETTAPTASCFVNEAFITTYSLEYNRIISLKTSATEPFYPLDSKYYGSHFYLYGTDKSQQLTVIKFDANGNEVGYKKLGQLSDPFNWGDDQFFDVNDDYLVFLGNSFKPDTTYGIESVFQFCRYKTILKTKNDLWETDKIWFEDETADYFDEFSENELVVFPNPFNTSISVLFNDPKLTYTSFELYDMNGKLIQKGQLSDASFQEIEIGAVDQGAYFINFISDKEQLQVKLIKM